MTIGARHRFGFYLFTHCILHTRAHNEAEKKVLDKLFIYTAVVVVTVVVDESNSEVQIEC